jgi:hypothetical protein
VPDASAQQPPAQQPPPQPPAQQPRPRRSLQQWQELLQEEVANSSAETGGAPALFNLKEAMRWIKGFAPEVPPLLDEHFDQYFDYIQDKHGPHVLACVLFFALGHHDVCKGMMGVSIPRVYLRAPNLQQTAQPERRPLAH